VLSCPASSRRGRGEPWLLTGCLRYAMAGTASKVNASMARHSLSVPEQPDDGVLAQVLEGPNRSKHSPDRTSVGEVTASPDPGTYGFVWGNAWSIDWLHGVLPWAGPQ